MAVVLKIRVNDEIRRVRLATAEFGAVLEAVAEVAGDGTVALIDAPGGRRALEEDSWQEALMASQASGASPPLVRLRVEESAWPPPGADPEVARDPPQERAPERPTEEPQEERGSDRGASAEGSRSGPEASASGAGGAGGAGDAAAWQRASADLGHGMEMMAMQLGSQAAQFGQQIGQQVSQFGHQFGGGAIDQGFASAQLGQHIGWQAAQFGQQAAQFGQRVHQHAMHLGQWGAGCSQQQAWAGPQGAGFWSAGARQYRHTGAQRTEAHFMYTHPVEFRDEQLLLMNGLISGPLRLTNCEACLQDCMVTGPVSLCGSSRLVLVRGMVTGSVTCSGTSRFENQGGFVTGRVA